MKKQKPEESGVFYPLSAWINRGQPLPSRFYKKTHRDRPNAEWSVYIGIEEKTRLHEADSSKWLSLKESRESTKSYLEQASDIISGLSGAWLDREEREMILDELGQPPLPCLPLYFITTGQGEKETLRYVGKTKTTKRFSGGHTAALKLHHPKYSKLKKNIYRGGIWFFFNDEYIALDWIQPEKLAMQLLDTIESHVIHSLQSELNSHKRKSSKNIWDFYIHIQNFSGSKFLNDTFI